MEERTCVLLVCVLATRDVDAKLYRAATSSRPCLHHLCHVDAVPKHLTVALEKHYAVATGGNAQDVVAAEEAVDTFTLRRRHAIAFLELHVVLELWSTTEPCPHRRV
jgi:hypothetical protein